MRVIGSFIRPALRPISIRAAAWAMLLLAAVVTPAVAAGDTALTVRVMEGRVTDRVTISAPVTLRVSFTGGACEGRRITVSIGRAGRFALTCGDTVTTAPAPLTIAPVSGSAILTVTTPTDEHRYRGTLTIREEGGTIVLINTVPLEEYLLSVVPAEITTTETAALKAQAILCRTFAVKNRGRHGGWDLCDLTDCQHYPGVEAETAAGTRAVTETEGLIVTYDGKPAEVFYHSSSGGATTSPAYVWGGPPIPYLTGVRDAVNGRDLSAASPDAVWSFTVEKRRLRAALTEAVGLPVTGIAVADRDPSGRAAAVRLSGAGRVLTGEEFRIIVCRRFGWGSLKSTLFDVREASGSYVFSGRGLGHGVGMSQWGAMELARMGRDYRRIIEFYFPGTEVEPVER